jgi:hypothetical protein
MEVVSFAWNTFMDKITTEAEWIAGTDPLLLVNAVADKMSDRKLRLLLVACCRRIWPLLQDRRLQVGVERAEEYAEGMRTDEELADAARTANETVIELRRSGERGLSFLGCAAGAVVTACSEQGYLGCRIHSFVGRYMKWSYAVMNGVDAAAEAAAHWLNRGQGTASSLSQFVAAERQGQCLLVRDIIGNPFRSTTLAQSWLTWNDGTVVRLAQTICQERAFDHLPVLADALEEAGCNDADILNHCRVPGTHVRGCWLIDAFLGRT